MNPVEPENIQMQPLCSIINTEFKIHYTKMVKCLKSKYFIKSLCLLSNPEIDYSPQVHALHMFWYSWGNDDEGTEGAVDFGGLGAGAGPRTRGRGTRRHQDQQYQHSP